MTHGLLLAHCIFVNMFSLKAYSDSDYASDLDDRRSGLVLVSFLVQTLVLGVLRRSL